MYYRPYALYTYIFSGKPLTHHSSLRVKLDFYRWYQMVTIIYNGFLYAWALLEYRKPWIANWGSSYESSEYYFMFITELHNWVKYQSIRIIHSNGCREGTTHASTPVWYACYTYYICNLTLFIFSRLSTILVNRIILNMKRWSRHTDMLVSSSHEDRQWSSRTIHEMSSLRFESLHADTQSSDT